MIGKRHIQRAGGFTLLEVLVALTIVGLGVVTLLQIFSLGLRLGSRSAANTEAITYGAQVMDELLARRKLPEGSESGVRGTESRWKSVVQAMRPAAGSLQLGSDWEMREVSLEITVGEAGRERRVDFKTLRLEKKQNQ